MQNITYDFEIIERLMKKIDEIFKEIEKSTSELKLTRMAVTRDVNDGFIMQYNFHPNYLFNVLIMYDYVDLQIEINGVVEDGIELQVIDEEMYLVNDGKWNRSSKPELFEGETLYKFIDSYMNALGYMKKA